MKAQTEGYDIILEAENTQDEDVLTELVSRVANQWKPWDIQLRCLDHGIHRLWITTEKRKALDDDDDDA